MKKNVVYMLWCWGVDTRVYLTRCWTSAWTCQCYSKFTQVSSFLRHPKTNHLGLGIQVSDFIACNHRTCWASTSGWLVTMCEGGDGLAAERPQAWSTQQMCVLTAGSVFQIHSNLACSQRNYGEFIANQKESKLASHDCSCCNFSSVACDWLHAVYLFF